MMLSNLSLIVAYLCVLLMKSCIGSPEVCATFGFGPTPEGIYNFFFFFMVGMLTLQLVVGAMRLWMEGYAPKIILVASAHAVSPTTVFAKLLTRRWAATP